MKALPNPGVIAWLNQQSRDTLFVTTTTLSELYFGIEALPAGKRKQEMARSLDALLEDLFGKFILPFDVPAARAYGAIRAMTKTQGYNMTIADAQIAAVARATGYTVATRDTGPFLAASIPVINPFTEGL